MRRLFLVLFLLLTAVTARAHDFWIEPSSFRPAVGSLVSASLRVGQDFVGDPVPRSAQRIEKFIVRDGANERPLVGQENRDPAGLLRLDTPGVAIIGYRSRPEALELPAQKFEEYLRSEGLESIIALRAKRGESAKPDKEIFSRCAKAILFTGGGGGGARHDKEVAQPLGFRFEIVPESNPYTAGGAIAFRLLFDGKPLRDALVTAIRQDDPGKPMRARSDRAGRVTLDLRARGVWLVKSVQIIPAPPSSGAEWESLWASVTFER